MNNNKPILNIPYPSSDEVNKYLKESKNSKNNTQNDSALEKVFINLLPNNTDINDVLIKVSLLNDFYSTNIFNTNAVSNHILSLNIDDRLKRHDLSLIKDIGNIKIGEKTIYFYSFATKYCSHHQRDTYPIYDSYLRKALTYFNKEYKFSEFKSNDLKDYVFFCKVLNDFTSFFKLDKCSKREIDTYLWLLGKEYFPNKY